MEKSRLMLRNHPKKKRSPPKLLKKRQLRVKKQLKVRIRRVVKLKVLQRTVRMSLKPKLPNNYDCIHYYNLPFKMSENNSNSQFEDE
jgi:hypothetical protein